MTHVDDTIPISRLFFDDAGPHVVRAGFPSRRGTDPRITPARGQELQALLDTSISQLGAVSGEARRKAPAPLPAPVPIATLLYGGARALDRALELREEILGSGAPVTGEQIDELLDLVALARAD